ncbi:hypothetical protein [Clostridium sp. ZS2]|uniref:hypothetical protein n=1 Tax=Clostridium sp. ZS2 TaxID=2949988 RepID=UPI0020798DBE|nr:hypothetical protein [Clostridium sp. ZS2]
MDSIKDIVLEKAIEQVVTLVMGKSTNEIKEILKQNEKQKILLRCFERFCESDLYKNEFGGTGCVIDKELILNVPDEKIIPELEEKHLMKNLIYVFKKCVLVDDINIFERISQFICSSYRNEVKKMLELFHIFQELQKGNIENNEARNEFRKYFQLLLENQSNAEVTIKNLIIEIKQFLNESLNTNENNKNDTIIESSNYKLALEYIKTDEFQDAISILRKLYSTCDNAMEKKKISFKIGSCYLNCSVKQKSDKIKIKNAINYLETSIKYIIEYTEDEDFLIYKNLSRAYEELTKYENPKSNYEIAEKHLSYAINLLKGVEYNKAEMIELQLDMARIYENFCEYCSISDAKKYFNKSITIYQSIIESEDNLPEELAFILFHNNGRIFEKKAELEDNDENLNLDNALKYYLEAEKVPYASVENNPEQFALLNNNLGNIYFKKSFNPEQDEDEYLEEAIRYYNLTLDVCNCEEDRNNFLKTSTNMARVFRRKYKKYNREEDYVKCRKNLENVLIYRTPKTDPIGYAYVKFELAGLYVDKVEINFISDSKDNQYVNEKEFALKYLSDAENLFKDCLSIWKKESYEKMYCNVLHTYAGVIALKGKFTRNYKDFENSLYKCKEVLSLCKASDNSYMFQVFMQTTINIMCDIFDYIEDIDEKYRWYLEQLQYLQEINAEKYSFPIYYDIAVILFEKYDDEDDIEFLKQALNYLSKCKSILDENLFDRHMQNMFDNLWQRIENEIEHKSN